MRLQQTYESAARTVGNLRQDLDSKRNDLTNAQQKCNTQEMKLRAANQKVDELKQDAGKICVDKRELQSLIDSKKSQCNRLSQEGLRSQPSYTESRRYQAGFSKPIYSISAYCFWISRGHD